MPDGSMPDCDVSDIWWMLAIAARLYNVLIWLAALECVACWNEVKIGASADDAIWWCGAVNRESG